MLREEWAAFRDAPLEYKQGETWDRLLEQGLRLLGKFSQDHRVWVPLPHQNLQLKIVQPLSGNNEVVAYLDAIGELDGVRRVLDWRTTTSRYPESLAGLVSLDPQLTCYSWISGISQVALVVFVRKAHLEIQYLTATIREEQRREFARLVETTVGQIAAAQFPAHSGIRFPQNGCLRCPHLGLCLDNQPLVDANLVRTLGASDLDWLDELSD